MMMIIMIMIMIWKMHKNVPTLAIGGVDTAEHEPSKVWGYPKK